jgi:CRP-like cAMP-binding protein
MTMLRPKFDIASLLSSMGYRDKSLFFRKKQIIFSQGDRSEAIFYVEKGAVKLTVVAANGKEAFVGLLDGGDFFGESCLSFGQPVRFYTATAVTDIQVVKIARAPMIGTLRTKPEFAYGLILYLLERNAQLQQELASTRLNSTEERVVQVLSFVERLGRRGRVVPSLTQQDLANIVGITRQRVNVVLQRLRKSASARPADPRRKN